MTDRTWALLIRGCDAGTYDAFRRMARARGWTQAELLAALLLLWTLAPEDVRKQAELELVTA